MLFDYPLQLTLEQGKNRRGAASVKVFLSESAL
jgi:hypothetical protein